MSERKSWVEVVIMPLVVAIVGIVGTYLITDQQRKSAEMLRAAQLETTKQMAVADRQIKILEIVSEKITSDKPDHRKVGLRLLGALDGELAEKIAEAFLDRIPLLKGESKKPGVREVAEQAKGEGAYRVEKRKVAEGTLSGALDRPLTGSYLMDKHSSRVIVLSKLSESKYRIEEFTSPWPWEGSATVEGKKLIGEASFRNSDATMSVEGVVREDGSIVVMYRFIKGSAGEPAGGRIDHHVWYPAR